MSDTAMNGSDDPALRQAEPVRDTPSGLAEPMDTSIDEPAAETQPQATAQPEPSAHPAETQPAGPQPANATTSATASAAASPRVEANPAPVDDAPVPGVQNVREILNSKINPFISAGLRQIFRDPANIPEEPLRILGEFLLEKHREITAKEAEPGHAQAQANGAAPGS